VWILAACRWTRDLCQCFGPTVGGCLAHSCFHRDMSWLNSHNHCAMMKLQWTVSLLLGYYYYYWTRKAGPKSHSSCSCCCCYLTLPYLTFGADAQKARQRWGLNLAQCASWWRRIVVRTPVTAGELSLSCARLMAGRVTTLWVRPLRRPLSVNQHGQLSLPSLRGRLNE